MIAHDLRLADRHLEKQRPEKALSLLHTSAVQQPDDADLFVRMGRAHEMLGDIGEAAAHYHHACSLDPGQAAALLNLARLSRWARITEASPVILRAFATCFLDSAAPPIDTMRAEPRELARLLGAQLSLNYRLVARTLSAYRDHQVDEPALDALVETLSKDRLLNFHLETFVSVDAGIEYALTYARRRWLLGGKGPEHRGRLRFLASLAVQCFQNEYAWIEWDAEEGRVEALESDITAWPEGPLAVGDEALERLLLYALYRPPWRLANADAIEARLRAGPGEVQLFRQLTLAEPLIEAALRENVTRLTSIDTDSAAVRDQYETNPYPRWRHLMVSTPQTFGRFVKQRYPGERFSWLRKPTKQMLVAGCGTGREPMQYARNFTDLSVLAVDLSAASLAHGQRQADQLGQERIEFRQADILNLGEIDQTFEFISSQGVLHHMGDPEAGLAVLAGLLVPDGLMRLGLYSVRGRDVVVRARAYIEKAGLAPSAADMRRFRHEILSEPETHGLKELVDGGNDFYCLSGLRDYLFHVREERYRPVDLETLLRRHDLEFLGFEFGDPNKQARYRQAFPQDARMRNLGNWEEFEAAHPGMVEGLYCFWARKRERDHGP